MDVFSPLPYAKTSQKRPDEVGKKFGWKGDGSAPATSTVIRM